MIVLYVSGHGFGHASRVTVLIDAIAALRPGARFVVRTAAAPWLFHLASCPAVVVQPCEADPGIVQLDDMTIDDAGTVRRAAAFYRDFEPMVEAEAAHLRAMDAALVIGDIPPLAFAAAARAGLPSVALGNFTWDWIYESHPAFASDAPDVVPTVRRAYAQASLALRLPMHGGFGAMPHVRDIPFIARRSPRDRAEVRRALDLGDDRPVVLASFSWRGVRPPYGELARSPRFALVTAELAPAGLRHEDLVAAADVVVSKPGYGIISECLANGAALVYTTRGPFIEQEMLVAEMPRFVRCRHLPFDDLLAGRWDDAIEAVLAQPAPAAPPSLDGAQVAAQLIDELAAQLINDAIDQRLPDNQITK